MRNREHHDEAGAGFSSVVVAPVGTFKLSAAISVDVDLFSRFANPEHEERSESGQHSRHSMVVPSHQDGSPHVDRWYHLVRIAW